LHTDWCAINKYNVKFLQRKTKNILNARGVKVFKTSKKEGI